MGRLLQIITFSLILSFGSDAFARSGRQTQIPNNRWSCDVCHTPAGGLNDFGFDSFDYTNGGSVDWSGFSQEDSDRDGYSNGLELADPNGTGANNGGMITHPGDRSDGLCGNNNMEGGEECELGDVGGETCASMGLVSGNLTCGDNCRFDTSGCDSCGDGVLDGNEECDGAALNSNTCESLGRGTGVLGCNGCSYDYAGCSDNSNPTPLTCGDGVRQVAESCDVDDLGGQTCATLGFTGGVLICEVRCTFDTTQCIGGNGMVPGDVPNPGGTPTTTPQAGAGGTTLDEPGDSIHLDGRACTTAPLSGSRTDSMLALLLAGALLVARRRR